jgi:DNA polymerase III delta prime subunit
MSDDDLDDFLAPEDPYLSDRSITASDDEESPRSTAFSALTSLILLVGPTGSGKTSSIKAVTDELGWDIFEVNGGMGRRGIKGLETMVGDVGRNHTVRKNNTVGNGGGGFFAKRETIAPRSSKTIADSQNQKGGEEKTVEVRQSVIVLEEVDLLFKKEDEFWTGALLRACSHPAIFTDQSLSDHIINRCHQFSERLKTTSNYDMQR